MVFNAQVGLRWNLIKNELTVGRIDMPYGPGTYGKKVGRPPAKKKKKAPIIRKKKK